MNTLGTGADIRAQLREHAQEIEQFQGEIERRHAAMTDLAVEYFTRTMGFSVDALYEHAETLGGYMPRPHGPKVRRVILRVTPGAGKKGTIIWEARQYDRKGQPGRRYLRLTTAEVWALKATDIQPQE